MRFIYKRRIDGQRGEIDMGAAKQFFGEKNTNDLRDRKICGVVNKYGALVFA